MNTHRSTTLPQINGHRQSHAVRLVFSIVFLLFIHWSARRIPRLSVSKDLNTYATFSWRLTFFKESHARRIIATRPTRPAKPKKTTHRRHTFLPSWNSTTFDSTTSNLPSLLTIMPSSLQVIALAGNGKASPPRSGTKIKPSTTTGSGSASVDPGKRNDVSATNSTQHSPISKKTRVTATQTADNTITAMMPDVENNPNLQRPAIDPQKTNPVVRAKPTSKLALHRSSKRASD